MPLRSVNPPLLVGITLEGRFQVKERVGADALTRIYHAVDQQTGSPVLVRMVHPHLAGIQSFADDFVPRVTAVRPLSHTSVLRTLSAGRHEMELGAFLYVATEAFEGRNLCAIVHGRGLLPPGQVTIIGIQALECLASAHKQGVLHLDLRPESIVIGATPDGVVRPKIADFGLGSLAAESMVRPTLGGTTLGTPVYSSPERLRDEDPDERSDVYSMGAILYEQYSGTAVFEAGASIDIERMILEQEPEPLHVRAPQRNIDPGIEEVILKALRKSPADRFQSAQEMAAALVMARGKESSAEAASIAPGARRDSRLLPSTLHMSVSGMTRRAYAVGRAEIIEAVRAAALAPVEEANHGSVIILLSEAGMGKSAVLDEVIAGLWGGPVGVVRVEGRRALHGPLEPFTEAARDMLGIRRGDDAKRIARVAKYLRERVRLSEEDVERLLDRVSGRASSLAVSLDVVEREEASSLRSFFGHVLATVPSVLFVEDADALDPGSAAFVLDLMESTQRHPVSVIVTARGEPWPEWKASNATRIPIGPLDDKHARSLVKDRLTGLDAPPEAIDAAVKACRGSPLMLDLCAQGMLVSAAERKGEPIAAPSQESARTLVDTALRRLPKDARRWLQCAALAGVRTPMALLEEFAPPSIERAVLLRECAVTNLGRVEGEHLVFRNEGVRDLIAELVAERDRRDIHRFIAKWLSAVHPARAPYEVIATQFEACGDYRAAAEHFEHAARDLLERGEPRPAAALLKRASHAFQSAQDDQNALRVGLDHVEALLQTADGKAANDALARLERIGPVSASGLRARIFARVARAQGDPEIALKALLRAAEPSTGKIDPLAHFEVQTDVAALLQELGRVAEAEQHAEQAYELAIRIFEENEGLSMSDSLRTSQAAAFLARLRASMRRFADARAVLGGALDHAMSRSDEASASRVLANLAYVASCEGDLKTAAAQAERALASARVAGDRSAAARIAVNLGAYQVKLGDLAGAGETLVFAKALSRSIGWVDGETLARDALRRLKSA
ncbi:MAG: protein kinase [Deltaproteobacteria bacterium]|nr:protein kinase [Deltaproteobacteria bacterium]